MAGMRSLTGMSAISQARERLFKINMVLQILNICDI